MKLKKRIKRMIGKIKCKLGFHYLIRFDRGETGEIYAACKYCGKEAE